MSIVVQERVLATSPEGILPPGNSFDFGPPASEISLGIVVLAATLLFKIALLTDIAANAGAAFLVILAMTFGLILPRMLFEGRGW